MATRKLGFGRRWGVTDTQSCVDVLEVSSYSDISWFLASLRFLSR